MQGGGRGGERAAREITRNTTFFTFFSDFFFAIFALHPFRTTRASLRRHKETTRAIKPATRESDTQRVKPKRKNVLLSTIILLPHFSIVSARRTVVERFFFFVVVVVFVFDDERSVASLHLDLFGGTERFPASPADARRTFGPRSHFYQFVRQARSVH